MTIGLLALYGAVGGSFTRLTSLLEDFAELGALVDHDIILYVSRKTNASLRRQLPDAILEAVRFRLFESRGWRRHWVEQAVLPSLLLKDGVDVVLGTANTIPYASKVPAVVLFQNALPFCEGAVGKNPQMKLRVALLRAVVKLSARRAAKVICLSRAFRSDLMQCVEIGIEKTSVIYPARLDYEVYSTEPAYERTTDGITTPYLVMVSHMYSYKNIVELIRGYFLALAQSRTQSHRLVLVGGFPDKQYFRSVTREIASHSRGRELVRVLGPVEGENIKAIVEAADGFVLSSTCEALPQALLEALALCRPIACSDRDVMREVCGDAALYFEPSSPASIASALSQLMEDDILRSRLSTLARQRRESFPVRPYASRSILEVLASVRDGTV